MSVRPGSPETPWPVRRVGLLTTVVAVAPFHPSRPDPGRDPSELPVSSLPGHLSRQTGGSKGTGVCPTANPDLGRHTPLLSGRRQKDHGKGRVEGRWWERVTRRRDRHTNPVRRKYLPIPHRTGATVVSRPEGTKEETRRGEERDEEGPCP